MCIRDRYDKLRKDHSLIKTMVPEIIRWQTPLAYMRRTALEDTEIRGKKIWQKGDDSPVLFRNNTFLTILETKNGEKKI